MEKISIVQRRFGKARSAETVALRRARSCGWADPADDLLGDPVTPQMAPEVATRTTALPEVVCRLSKIDSIARTPTAVAVQENRGDAPKTGEAGDAMVMGVDLEQDEQERLRRTLSLEEMAIGDSRELSVVMTKESALKVVFRFGREDDALLTTEDACRLLRVSKSFLYRKIHTGELPALRIGRYLRFCRKSLLGLVEGAVA